MKKFVIFLFLLFVCAHPGFVHAGTFTETPSHIIIPSLTLSLPVHTSKIIFDTWEVRLDGASFGEGTTLPGNVGNTVIFSHAMANLFGKLPSIKKDDLVYVFTKHDWFTYKVEDTFIVSPDRVDILKDRNRYDLTLYTCTGPQYSQRFIVKTRLINNPAFLTRQ